MRLNKSDKKGRGWSKADGLAKPKFITSDVVIGRVSSDVISTYFAPKVNDIGVDILEKYADDLVTYDDLMRDFETEEVEVEADGTVRMAKEAPTPPPKPLFHSQFMVDEFAEMASETAKHFSEKGGWRVHVNAAKFERSLDEKYGIFRPFITNHPEIEVFIRSVQRKYAMGYFSPFRQGSPPIPKSTSVILLFMMQRQNVRWDAMLLIALFLLVGLQPWALVAIVALFQHLVNKRTKKPVGKMHSKIDPVEPYWGGSDDKKSKHDALLKPVGTAFGAGEKVSGSDYDTIIIGSGPDSLYTGALLSRGGRKVLVFSPGQDASGCLTIKDCKDKKIMDKYKSVPFDVEASNVSRVTRQQELLTPALCTSSDYQGGVRFAQIGSEADGYAFEILSIPGMGADSYAGQIPFVLRAAGGHRGLMDDTATFLGDGWPGSGEDAIGGSTSGMYLQACASINASAGAFYLSKVLEENSKSFQSNSSYGESACRYASSFLNKCFPLNAHLRSLMAGIGMKGENIKPSLTSMGAHVTNICAATSGEGMFYPVGGPRSLCQALASVIEQNGGRVFTEVPVKELIFEKVSAISNSAPASGSEEAAEPIAPRCIGVKLHDDREVKFDEKQLRASEKERHGTAIINMNGFIDTFVRLLPEDIRTTHKVPMGLPALSERRPLFKILFALKGSAEDLNVTGADYYRLPGAAIAHDHIDPNTGAITLGEIGWSDEATPELENKDDDEGGVAVDKINEEGKEEKPDDAGQTGVRGKRTKVAPKMPARVKFDAGISWLQISFPSAKDPSWEERHGKVTTCVVTIEADDDFIVHYNTKPKLYSIIPNKVNDAGNRSRLMERVKRDLLGLYPQLEGKHSIFFFFFCVSFHSCRYLLIRFARLLFSTGKIEHEELRGPFPRGLSHNPERYAAKGIRTDTPYPGLFIGGSDLTVGESFSGAIVGGWLAANAVMGYSTLDLLFLEKNITSDLERFLDSPVALADPESVVAVPYEPKKVPDVTGLAEDEEASADTAQDES